MHVCFYLQLLPAAVFLNNDRHLCWLNVFSISSYYLQVPVSVSYFLFFIIIFIHFFELVSLAD